MGVCQSQPQSQAPPSHQARSASARSSPQVSAVASSPKSRTAATAPSSPQPAPSPKHGSTHIAPVYLKTTIAQFEVAASPTAAGPQSAAPWASPTTASVTLVQRQPSTTPANGRNNNGSPVQRTWSQGSTAPTSTVTSFVTEEQKQAQYLQQTSAKRGSASTRVRLAETSEAQLRREVDALTIPLSSPQRAEARRVAAAKEKAEREADFILPVPQPRPAGSDDSVADTCSGWLCASGSTGLQRPCSKLICVRCEQQVVWLEGRRWRSPEDACYLFLRTHHPSLESLSDATEPALGENPAATRAYACQCAATTIEQGQEVLAGFHHGLDGSQLRWKCGSGHATQDSIQEQQKIYKQQQQLQAYLRAGGSKGVKNGAAAAAQRTAPKPSEVNFDDDDIEATPPIPTSSPARPLGSSISLPPLKGTPQRRGSKQEQQETSPFMIA